MRFVIYVKNSNFNVLMAVFLDFNQHPPQFIGHIFSLSFRIFLLFTLGLETGKIMLTFIELLIGVVVLWV